MAAYDLVCTTARSAERPNRTRPPHFRLAAERVEPRVAVYALAIFLFSTLDAALTLTMVGAGFAHEINPFMRALLEADVRLFINVKLGITGTALIFLCACAERVVFGRIRIVQVLGWLVGFYAILIGYEVCMLLFGLVG